MVGRPGSRYTIYELYRAPVLTKPPDQQARPGFEEMFLGYAGSKKSDVKSGYYGSQYPLALKKMIFEPQSKRKMLIDQEGDQKPLNPSPNSGPGRLKYLAGAEMTIGPIGELILQPDLLPKLYQV